MTTAATGERVAYFNGEIMPESEVKVPFRDRGFKYGDAVFDMTRTFGHKIFKIETHISRFYNSLRYVDIDPGMSEEEMVARSGEVLEANLDLLGPDEDYWVGQRVSRGVDLVGGDMWETAGGPNVIIECAPLPLKPRARLYKDGMDVLVPSVRRVPPESLSPRAKSHNYLNLIMADMEAKSQDPEAWAILLDTRGFLTEGIGSNIFTIKDGVIYTPQEQYVLGGISRETAIEMAERIDVPVVTKDLDLFDAMTADEIFLTSTSLCICGVRSFQGRQIGDGVAAGPITKALMDAYVDFVDFDWIGQYLKRLED
ncbi:MAG TPA: aminotransferase class IV [Dehalococcoidia bacterium]|jgi:branched-chain amino acid aminotransferase|nr:aminotransferase class IV [Dehalococcoidia bacterium]MDP7262723.1 aminotransferase class IV [Dehalococcoidia bacterium]MDP7485283.1 aminotransferase class IV [Dehalococcoidia bacterium]HJP28877.1 aminotransferase class IV [Dehalococcoidia bacterium]|tara:strand:- start:2124 stop:3059 length:936 start_codon:yes stop_codon:yes gene_type:complete